MTKKKRKKRQQGILTRILSPIVGIVSGMAILILLSIGIVFTKGYEIQIYTQNAELASAVSGQVETFMQMAYNLSAELAENEAILSMENGRQVPVLTSNITRNNYFELLYTQGMDGMQTARSSGELGDRSNRWWFQQITKNKEAFVSKSYYSVGTQMPCASVFVPMLKDNSMIGVFGADLKLDSLLDLTQQYSDTKQGKYSFIIDGEGVVVAHPEKECYEELYNYVNYTKTVSVKDEKGETIYDEEGNILTEEQPIEISNSYQKVIEEVMAGNTGSVKLKNAGKTLYVSYKPIRLLGNSNSWSVISVQEESYAMALRNKILMVAVIMSVILLVIGIFIMNMVARKIVDPLKKITICVGKVAEGNFDIRVDESDKTEIGTLAKGFNKMTEQISGILQKTATVTEDVSNSQKDLVEISECTEIIKNYMGNIMEGAKKQQDQTGNVTSISTKLQEGFERLELQSKQMVKQADKSFQLGKEGSDKVEHLQQQSEQTLKDIQCTVDDIYALREQSESIQSIISTITSISDETELLALNASIEAARAGEQGKGFAIVAQQISKLASSSNDATGDISNIILGITEKVIQTVEKANNIREAYLGQMNYVEEVDKAFQNMNIMSKSLEHGVGELGALMEEMSELGKQIVETSENIARISDGTSEMAIESKEMLEKENENLKLFMEKLSKLAETSGHLKQDMEKFQA
ncbi:MAG: methyl-accepting chemotaxis protein [Lachnospiraceae bacterium]|nr:methyl-accepting chemotaxis protein [Lachnospiraceae bacterium]